MLTGALTQCAAALCATMSPQQAEVPLEPSTPVEATTEDMTPEEEPPSASTEGLPESATVEVAAEEAPASTDEAPIQIVMVTSPMVQPLDLEVELDAIGYVPDVPVVTPSADAREIECLALNIYHEARGEPTRGRYAVAWVTINRMQSAEFPDTVCEVVYQSTRNRRTGRRVAQFSWIFQNPAAPRGATWTDAQRIAETVYAQRNNRSGTHRLSSGVMYYHATSGVSQRNLNWFRRALLQVVRIGDHIFYTER